MKSCSNFAAEFCGAGALAIGPLFCAVSAGATDVGVTGDCGPSAQDAVNSAAAIPNSSGRELLINITLLRYSTRSSCRFLKQAKYLERLRKLNPDRVV